ncbi:MAG: zinc-ribbon domain-containing protein [Candidatus Lokiarchaeota archaeon]|nr:zinc-ribbon domain-containing protein [Candidatus Lokiarchaeota archaeon]
MSERISWPHVCMGCAQTNQNVLESFDYKREEKVLISSTNMGNMIRQTFRNFELGVHAVLCPDCKKRSRKRFYLGLVLTLPFFILFMILTLLYLVPFVMIFSPNVSFFPVPSYIIGMSSDYIFSYIATFGIIFLICLCILYYWIKWNLNPSKYYHKISFTASGPIFEFKNTTYDQMFKQANRVGGMGMNHSSIEELFGLLPGSTDSIIQQMLERERQEREIIEHQKESRLPPRQESRPSRPAPFTVGSPYGGSLVPRVEKENIPEPSDSMNSRQPDYWILCKRCGNKNKPNDNFCFECGSNLKD